MQGIVTLLDGASAPVVRALWSELERDWGLRGAARAVPFPHLSYQIAVEYDQERTGEAMRRVASRMAPFAVRITGLGAFTAIEPVLYLAVERSPALDALHSALWREMEEIGFAREPSLLYAPASWVPHVTLAQRDLSAETLAAVLAAWSGRDLRQEARIGDLGLFAGESYTPKELVQLSEAGVAGR